jgi:NodT family efflux transporter outer membrane factor (OMF) lipoprotein
MKCPSLYLVTALLATYALSGCKVGPNYRPPAMPAPPTYSDDGHNGNWQQAKPADDTERDAWWTVYNDAELNTLEGRCTAANSTIAAALHAYEQAHDLVSESKASLYPTVSIGGAANRDHVSNTRPLRPANQPNDYWDFLIPLNISWAPDFFGGIRRQIESASAAAQSSSADLANTRLSLQGLLAVSYFQLRGIDLQAQILGASVDAYTQSLDLTQNRFKGGLSTESDVEQATAQLEQARAELIDLGVERASLEHAVAVLVDVPATGFHIEERPLAGDPPSIPIGIPSELLQRRPDIAAAERKVAAANALIGVAKAAYYPNITLGATGGIESDMVSQVFSSGSALWSAGPNVGELIYDGGRRKAQVAYAIAERDQATSLYRGEVLSAFREVEDQLAALRVLEHEAGVQQHAVDAAHKSTQLSTLRYKRGLTQYLEVLTNQTIELNDQRTAAALVTRRIVAAAQLQMALGGGWDTSAIAKN